MSYKWRITKYNPVFRDEWGNYQRNEWTSVYDIGRSFDGKVLTMTEYLNIETKYVEAISHFAINAGVELLNVVHLENYEVGFEALDEFGLEKPPFDVSNISEGCKLKPFEIEHVCRLILREVIWAKLENAEKQFFVHFGYDYYMYIGTKLPLTQSVEFVNKSGLFVENMDSPYK